MARYAIAGRSTVVGTTVRAIASLYSTAAVTARVVEVGVFNTTAVAVAVAFVRLTNATGVGAGLTESKYRPDSVAATCTGFAGHTADSAVGDVLAYASLGAAVGAGVIWTFGDGGVELLIGTANGAGVICPVGTGQILDYYYVFDE